MSRYAEFHRRSLEEPEAFWREQAGRVDWQRPFDTVCDNTNPPFSKWFVGGRLNLCHNAVDRHAAKRPDDSALIWVSTEVDKEEVYSFAQLQAEVQRMAGILLSLGVRQGDRVLIYMPMIPQAVFAMLACTRIGAVHSVVFGGFASVSLASRIDDAQPVVIVSADAGSRSGKVVPYKGLLDEAIRLAGHKPRKVLMVDRGLAPMQMEAGRDEDYAALRSQHIDAQVPCTWVESTHPSYTLYTSGTTRQAQGRAARQPAAMRWRWPRAWSTSSSASRARPISPPATSAGWWATATSSTARCWRAWRRSSTKACRPGRTPASGGAWSRSTA